MRVGKILYSERGIIMKITNRALIFITDDITKFDDVGCTEPDYISQVIAPDGTIVKDPQAYPSQLDHNAIEHMIYTNNNGGAYVVFYNCADMQKIFSIALWCFVVNINLRGQLFIPCTLGEGNKLVQFDPICMDEHFMAWSLGEAVSGGMTWSEETHPTNIYRKMLEFPEFAENITSIGQFQINTVTEDEFFRNHDYRVPDWVINPLSKQFELNTRIRNTDVTIECYRAYDDEFRYNVCIRRTDDYPGDKWNQHYYIDDVDDYGRVRFRYHENEGTIIPTIRWRISGRLAISFAESWKEAVDDYEDIQAENNI
jgi:hypothetical protein